LRKNGLTKEGIFRVNGSERRINNSLKVFNETAGYGFGFDFNGMNVFDAASLLKLYLRQLPEPLIPFCLYSSFLDVISKIYFYIFINYNLINNIILKKKKKKNYIHIYLFKNNNNNNFQTLIFYKYLFIYYMFIVYLYIYQKKKNYI